MADTFLVRPLFHVEFDAMDPVFYNRECRDKILRRFQLPCRLDLNDLHVIVHRSRLPWILDS